MTTKEIIEDWVEVFNRGDAELLAEFYAENAVNHQVAEQPVEGKQAIRNMFKAEFACTPMTCLIENIFEDGDWAIPEWKDPLGLRGCGFFQFEKEKIILQRGYWDKLTFLRMHHLPIPDR